MESLQKVALVFTIIGAIVWGLIGLFDFNLVDYLFVEMLGINFLAKLIYIIVGICGIINIGILFNHIETK
ncbi:MAG: DUF378 domain-containing protein [Lactobacillales bacterium]|nr:DUF378 domain-containing protein [Lactobacillales bacterium]